MKALTLTEPFGTLMMLKAKRVETRSSKLPNSILGQNVIIHSAKAYPKMYQRLCNTEPFRSALRPGGVRVYPDLNRTKGLCVVRFIACLRTEDVRSQLTPQELAFGNYLDGRYAWFTEYVERWTDPTPHVGRLRFWEW
jgi:hypothetical protein